MPKNRNFRQYTHYSEQDRGTTGWVRTLCGIEAPPAAIQFSANVSIDAAGNLHGDVTCWKCRLLIGIRLHHEAMETLAEAMRVADATHSILP